jgi:hypothetical protein
MQFEFNSEEFKKWCEKYSIHDVNINNVESIHLDSIQSDVVRLGTKDPYKNITIPFKDISILHKLQAAIKEVLFRLKDITITRNGETFIQNKPSAFRFLKDDLVTLNSLLTNSKNCFSDWPHEKLNQISNTLELISQDSISIKGPLADDIEKEITNFATLYDGSRGQAAG